MSAHPTIAETELADEKERHSPPLWDRSFESFDLYPRVTCGFRDILRKLHKPEVLAELETHMPPFRRKLKSVM